MAVYYSLILWVGIVSIFSLNIKDIQRRNKIVIIMCCFGIFIIQALRAEFVGVDLIGYLRGYHIVKDINVFAGERLFNYEVGYILYSQVLSKLNIPNQLYLSIVALTIIVPLAYTWIKNSKMPALSIFMYITLGFFTFSFSGLRQSIAMAIIFFSFKYIQDRSLVKFLILIVLAMSFHTSAVIFVIAYPLYYFRIKPTHFIIIVPFLVIVFLFRNKLFLLIYSLYKGVPGIAENTNAYTLLVVMIVVLMLAYIFGDKNSNNLNFNAYKNYMLMAIIVQIFASESMIITRAGYYYFMFITLLIPDVINVQRDIKIRIVTVFVLILSLLYFFQTTTGNGYLNVSPYYFYWQSKMYP
jgi:hypothetical protein